jgi:hypothetical protein
VGAVTLFVLEGRARVTLDSTAPVDVVAGQKWSSRTTRPSPIATSTALTASTETGDSKPNQKSASGASSSANTSLERLSRDQLIAEAKRLRSENIALSQQNKEMQKKLEQGDAKADAQRENYYRPTPDELRALAEKGELRLRPPSVTDGHSLYAPQVASDLGLQSDEESKIREIYTRSNQRLHDGLVSLYVRIGGDPNVANALETQGLLQELQSKTVPQDRQSAALTATRERAGLETPANPDEGSALLRAYRLFFREEDRVFDELDALLGPDRAEQFVNHQNTSHNVLSNRVLPDRPKR